MSLLGYITGRDARKAAKKAQAAADAQNALNQQRFDRWAAPYLDMQLDQTKANQPTQNYMRGLANNMLGMPDANGTVPSASQPWFMQVPQDMGNFPGLQSGMTSGNMAPPELQTLSGLTGGMPEVQDWRTPFTPEQISSYMDVANLNMNNVAQQMGNQRRADMSARGLGGLGSTSSLDASLLPQLQMWQMGQTAQAKQALNQAQMARSDQLWNQADQRSKYEQDQSKYLWNQSNDRSNYLWNQANTVGLQQEDINRNRRGEATNNFWNMYGAANSPTPTGQYSQYMPTFSNQAQNMQNQANMQSQAAGNAFANLGSAIGQMFGG